MGGSTDVAERRLAEGIGQFDDELAVVAADGQAVSYRELATRVDALRDALGPTRRLVLISGSDTVEMLSAYLAALAGRHPVMLAGSDASYGALLECYKPDVTFGGPGAGGGWTERRRGSAHDLHPDLALMLSTSGSTGSPKLVRLSYENVQSNAEAIAQYLELRSDDRAAMTLPLHYCYGLSVVNSHLAMGAAVILCNESVVDGCFWRRFTDFSATSFAGVPYTFDLLDRVGFDTMELPSLRYVTQAGGRLAPDKVRRYARLGDARGWRFYVMYGQTEATARMAYLPPDLALEHPQAIGIPIPGGSFTIEATDGGEDGELVYRGPNVMLGYAQAPEHLALGRTVDALRTGDLARRTPAGLFEVIGRKNRFAKIFGLRIDLDRVEALLAEHGCKATCAGTDEEIVVAVPAAQDASAIAQMLHDQLALPKRCVRVFNEDDVPRLPSGKPDYPALVRLGLGVPASEPTSHSPDLSAGPHRVRQLFAEVLDVDVPDDDATFVSLGGDSLSYVEASIALEEMFGPLPSGWHLTPVRDLERNLRQRRQTHHQATDVVLRAVATLLILGTHVRLFHLQGGAHLLLAMSGFYFARFMLVPDATAGLLRRVAPTIRRIAVPTVVVMALVFAVERNLSLPKLFLVNNYVNGGRWHYWYIEVLIQTLVLVALIVSVPLARRIERAHPFATAMAFVGIGLVMRLAVAGELVPGGVLQTHDVFWLFALGWAIERATSAPQRALVLACAFVGLYGFFGNSTRELLVLVGLALLCWLPRVPVPRLLHPVTGAIAASSLYIYLTQFEVYPILLLAFPPVVVLPATVAVGIGIDRGVAAVRARGKGYARESAAATRRALLPLRHLGRKVPTIVAEPVGSG
jgi:acyl-CoA synthetase (AMP-forming)/AMP-acid ligase II